MRDKVYKIMSFTTEIKNELISVGIKTTCCRRALGEGLGFCAEIVDGKNELTIGSLDIPVREYVSKMLRERYQRDIDIRTTCVAGRVRDKYSYDSLPVDKSGDPRLNFRCDGCAVAFVRGIFIAVGTVSNPESSYHAEMLLRDASKAKTVFEILSEFTHAPKIVNRKNGVGLYYKGSEAIEELLMFLGANAAAFNIMNCKIEKDIRNAENRATNCVARNISKTVGASQRQITDIETLKAAGRLETLAYDIRITAKLRLENPDCSLQELAAKHIPPISKSGLNHRLAKISEEAKKVKNH